MIEQVDGYCCCRCSCHSRGRCCQMHTGPGPSAVTCTRDAFAEICESEAGGEAWQDLSAAVRGEEVHVHTGSEMVNQYRGYFFCQAGGLEDGKEEAGGGVEF